MLRLVGMKHRIKTKTLLRAIRLLADVARQSAQLTQIAVFI